MHRYPGFARCARDHIGGSKRICILCVCVCSLVPRPLPAFQCCISACNIENGWEWPGDENALKSWEWPGDEAMCVCAVFVVCVCVRVLCGVCVRVLCGVRVRFVVYVCFVVCVTVLCGVFTVCVC